MFLITGSSRSSLSSLRSDIRAADASFNSPFMANGNSLPRPADPPIKPGNIDAYESLTNLLDCCILYYYAVAHKYVIMVNFPFLSLIEKRNYVSIILQISDLRDSIGILSDILCESKSMYSELSKTMETIGTDSMISSTHDEIMKELNEKLTERIQVFTVS